MAAYICFVKCAMPIAAMLLGTTLLLMPQVHASVVAANTLHARAIAAETRAAETRAAGTGAAGDIGHPDAAWTIARPAGVVGLIAGSALILVGIGLGAASVLTPSPARRSP